MTTYAVVSGELLSGQWGGCSWYRAGQALAVSGLNRGEEWVAGYEGTVGEQGLAVKDVATGKLLRPDVLIAVRWSEASLLEYTRVAHVAGQHVVIDWDDALWAVPPTNVAHHVAARNHVGSWMYALEASARYADVVTCSTEVLADRLCDRARKHGYRRLDRKVVVVPNMIDISVWPRVRPAKAVVWTGSVSHRDQELWLLASLGRRVRERGIKAVHIGPGKLPRWQNLGSRPITEWHTTGEVAGVGVAPLCRSAFSDCKSHVKVLEYAAAGRAIVCSAHPAYADWAHCTVQPSDPDDWDEAVISLATDLDQQAQLGAMARAHAVTYDVRCRWTEFFASWQGELH